MSAPSYDLSFGMASAQDPTASFGTNTSVIGNNQGSSKSGEDDSYTHTVRQMTEALREVPGKVSEKSIRQLAVNNKLEVFEDQIPGGKRLSIGGLIVLIDIDMNSLSGAVSDVKISFASTMEPTNDATSFRSKRLQSSNIIDTILYRSLQQPRLDEFSRILQFLSKGDQLSIPKSPDCFLLIDEVSNALFQVYETYKTRVNNADDPSLFPYGIPVLNPDKDVGLGIWYWTKNECYNPQKHLVMWSIRQGSENPAGFNTSWVKSIDTEEQEGENEDPKVVVEWNAPEKIENSKTEFVLELSPPLRIPLSWAKKIHKGVSGKTTSEECLGKYSRKVYHSSESEGQYFDFIYANLTPSDIIHLSSIPISHPQELPRIFDELRQLALLSTLWDSIIEDSARGDPERIKQAQDLKLEEEISFADAIMEESLRSDSQTQLQQQQQQPQQQTSLFTGRLPVSISMVKTKGEHVITINIQSIAFLTILPKNRGTLEVFCASMTERFSQIVENAAKYLENIPLLCAYLVHELRSDADLGDDKPPKVNTVVSAMNY